MTTLVMALTIVTMVAEVGTGWWTNSMALLADGWHMGVHATAMGVAILAYRFMRRHADAGRYAGMERAGDLGGFANAMMLAVVALLVAGASITRLATPAPIDFTAALTVAVIGLGVNLISAWLLREQSEARACGHDPNREAAFVHVLSDALTSVLAIAALWGGRRYGIMWLDPLMSVVGSAVILRWFIGLLKRTNSALLSRQ